MKYATYSLVAVIVLGLGAGLTLLTGVTESPRTNISAARQAQPRDVYVDISKLVKLHPSWDAVEASRAAVRDPSIELQSPGEARCIALPGKQSPRPDAKSTQSALREELGAEAAKAAESALADLEAQQTSALQARARESRETMEQNAKVELRLRAQEIESVAAGQQREASDKYGLDRVNAQLRESALEAATRSPGSIGTAAKVKLDAMRTELERFDQVSSEETAKTQIAAESRIADFSDSLNSRIDAAMSIYASGELKRIENRASTARGDILAELYAFDFTSPVARPVPRNTIQPTTARIEEGRQVCSVSSAGTDAAGLNREMARVEERMRSDIERAVQVIGREKGVRVSFSKNGQVLPDETSAFAGELRSRVWDLCGPVLLSQPRG